eukprot:6199676-Pleurochrysis_carterae.AAC.1
MSIVVFDESVLGFETHNDEAHRLTRRRPREVVIGSSVRGGSTHLLSLLSDLPSAESANAVQQSSTFSREPRRALYDVQQCASVCGSTAPLELSCHVAPRSTSALFGTSVARPSSTQSPSPRSEQKSVPAPLPNYALVLPRAPSALISGPEAALHAPRQQRATSGSELGPGVYRPNHSVVERRAPVAAFGASSSSRAAAGRWTCERSHADAGEHGAGAAAVADCAPRLRTHEAMEQVHSVRAPFNSTLEREPCRTEPPPPEQQQLLAPDVSAVKRTAPAFSFGRAPRSTVEPFAAGRVQLGDSDEESDDEVSSGDDAERCAAAQPRRADRAAPRFDLVERRAPAATFGTATRFAPHWPQTARDDDDDHSGVRGDARSDTPPPPPPALPSAAAASTRAAAAPFNTSAPRRTSEWLCVDSPRSS